MSRIIPFCLNPSILLILVYLHFFSSNLISDGIKVTQAQKNLAQDTFADYSQEVSGTDIVFEMKAIKGGVFAMGDNEHKADERPSHMVELSDFYMSTYEITWDQYELFLERQIDGAKNEVKEDQISLDVDAIASATPPYVDMSHGMGKKNFPVVNVTQHAALTFCKWLSAKTGKFYRLPTEAEWEYACRAGSNKDYSFGNDEKELSAYAWYGSNSNNKYQKVGTKLPNAFGLYDMHGNVAEWTMDGYSKDGYSKTTEILQNPWTIPITLYPRTVRGGSWMDSPEALRSSARKASTPEWKRIDPQIPKSRWWHTNAPMVGFRIVSPKNTPSEEEIATYWLEAIDDF